MRLPKRQEKARFWELIRSGVDRAEAARRAGVPATSARHWFRQAGGVLPPSLPETSRTKYLSIREREEIFAGVERGESIRRIAPASWSSVLDRAQRAAKEHVSPALPGPLTTPSQSSRPAPDSVLAV